MKTFNHNSGRYFEINGVNIYSEEIGNRDKPVLLMLHGGFGDIEDLNSIASYLVEGYRIIGIDSRGHGKSTLGSEKLTYGQIQSDIEEILKQLNITTISIIGFSDGGIAGYRIAASHNVKVKKLITMGASWSEKDVTKAEPILKTLTPESVKEIFSNNVERYQRFNPEPDVDLLTRSVVSMELDKTETGHPNESVNEITSKTLLIRGDNDFLVSLESLAELQSRIVGSSFMNVPFAEHVVHEEQPKVVEMMLKHFLNT